mgnify:CR=1 FL=1
MKFTQKVTDTLKNKRNEGYNILWQDVIKFGKKMQLDEPVLPRQQQLIKLLATLWGLDSFKKKVLLWNYNWILKPNFGLFYDFF